MEQVERVVDDRLGAGGSGKVRYPTSFLFAN